MAISISLRSLVVIGISVVAIILGVVFLFEVMKIKDVIEFPVSSIVVNVEPQSSQAGTVFLITARTGKTETQDIILKIKSKETEEGVILFDDGEHYDGKTKDGNYGGFFDSTGKATGKYEVLDEKESLAYFQIYEEGCENIEGISGKNKINFVILPFGYSNLIDFKEDAINILTNGNSLMNMDPFKSEKEKFSFSVVNTQENLDCRVGYQGVPTIIKCDNKKVLQEASRCKHDSIVVLVNNDDLCGSSSGNTAKICSKNPSSNIGLAHEIGHSFADLADEYVYDETFEGYDIGEINNANCDVELCPKWSTYESNCIKGCTYSSLYKSSEESIMNNLAPYFNIVSVNHIKNVISEGIKTKEEEKPLPKSYFVNLKYKNESIKIQNVYLKPLDSRKIATMSNYEARISDDSGSEIFTEKIKIPNLIFPITNSKPAVDEDFEFSLLIPYFGNADKLEIKKDGQVVTATSLAVFSETCRNGICDKSENHLSCKEDCSIKDGFCEKSECDPDCQSQKNCQVLRKAELTFSVLVIIVSGAILFYVAYRVIKK